MNSNTHQHQQQMSLKPLSLTTAQLQNGSNSHSENSSYNENQRQQTQRPHRPELAAAGREEENLRTSGSLTESSKSSAQSRDMLVKRTVTGTFSTAGTIAGDPVPFLAPLSSEDSREAPQMSPLNLNVLSTGEQISGKSGRSESKEEETLRPKQTNRPNTPLTASDPSSTPLPVVAAVSEIPCTPVTVTPSLTANPRELQPLPIKAAARLTNPTMERLAKEAAAKQFRADILKARVPAPNVIVNDIDEIDLLSAVGGGGNASPVRGGSEAFNAAVNATSPANKSTKALIFSSSSAAAAASSPTKRRKGKGVVTVLNGLRQSLTAAGVLLFAGYTPSILQAVPTAHMSPSRSKEGNDKVRLHLMLKARRRSRSRASSTTSSNTRARRASNAAESTSSSVNTSAVLADKEEDSQARSQIGEKKWSAAVEASRSRQGVAQLEERERQSYVQAESSFMSDPVDDLMSLQRGESAHKNSPNRKTPKKLFQVTSSRTAPAVGTSRLNPLLKAVRLQQTLLSQDLPLPILHADDGIDLAWVQKFIVDDVVYPIYQGAQIGENFIANFNKQLEREEREKDAKPQQDHNVSLLQQQQQQQRYPPSPYPLLDFLLQRGTTAPIRFHSSGRDIPLEILQRAAAGEPIVLAEDEAGFDDMGESLTYGKRNLVDFLKWRVRTVGKWAAEAKEKGVGGFEEGLAASSIGQSPRRLVLPGSHEISDANDKSMTEKVNGSASQKASSDATRKGGRGLTLILGGADDRAGNANPEDDDDDASLNHFGAIDSPRSALVCFRHGLRVSSWYTLRTPQGLARHSPQRRRPNTSSSTKDEESRPETHRGQSSGSLSSSQAKAIASAITSESIATDSLLPIVEDYKILCKTITQKFAIYVMTMAALDHLTARVPVPRDWAEVSGAALRAGGSTPRRGGTPILALTNGNHPVEDENDVDERLRVLLETEAQKHDKGVRGRQEKRPTSGGDAEISENESPKKDAPTGGRVVSLHYGLMPSPTSTNRGLGRSLKMSGRQLTPLISDKRPLTAGSASVVPQTQIMATTSPQRAGVGPFLQPLSLTTQSSTALVPTTQSSSGGQGNGEGNARTPMADLLQRSHDDLLIEWAKRQQNFARELYTDRRVAKAVEQRRAEKIKKARDCQTPLQLRMAAQREERIERELAVREAERKRMRQRRNYGGKQQRERRRRSMIGGDDGGEASEGSESDLSTFSGQEQQRDNLHGDSRKRNFTSQKGGRGGRSKRNVQTIIEEMEAEAERAYRGRRGPGAGGSRYHPDRYVPLLASSSDEDLDEISICSHSSCSECEITHRRRERRWAKAGGATTALTSGGEKVRVALPRNNTTSDAFDSAQLGGNVKEGSAPVPNNASAALHSPQEAKREKGTRRDRQQQQPQRRRSSSPLASALYLVNNPSASPSEVFLEMQRGREQERVAQRLASVERKEKMIEEASKRRVEGFQEHRHRNELGKAKAEEVNARLERKLLFGKLLMANKSHQQEHKDAQKKALAKERAKQVSSETKAKGALASRSREVFEQARVAVHKSLYLQEKLNTDYRAKSSHGEYHHHANVGSVSGNGTKTTTPTRVVISSSSPLDVVASPARTNEKSRSPRARGGEDGSMREDTIRSLSSSSPPMSPDGSRSARGGGRGGSPRGPHVLTTVSSCSSPSKPSTSAMVEDMFNQAIDARKAVSRNALSRHLSSQRAIVKRWQELEGTMYEAHSNLRTSQTQGQGQGPLQKR